MTRSADPVEFPPVEYRMTERRCIRDSVWTLWRNSRVLMRSRNKGRVRSALYRQAVQESARSGRAVLTAEPIGGGLTCERYWEPDQARVLAAGPIVAILDAASPFPMPAPEEEEGGDS